jgi:hypothetical protein
MLHGEQILRPIRPSILTPYAIQGARARRGLLDLPRTYATRTRVRT